jgi:hypothetical protein
MATIIKIKRSSGTSTPNLGQGELGYSWGSSTYSDNQGATVTSYGKLFLGTGTETGGVAANIEIIGGKYFTDLLDHGHGNLTASSAVVVDSASKIDIWNVDNLRLDGNTLSSTNTDGDINLDPNGSGEIVIPDDTYLTFGTSKDAKIKYDETTDDRVEVSGADWNFSSGVSISLSDTTASTSTSTGAFVVSGGVGIGGDLYIGGSINVGNLATPSNFTVSGDLTVQGGDVNFTDAATNLNLKDNTPSALNIKEGSNSYIKIDTTDGSELITFGTTDVDIDNDLNVDGGNITTNQTTFNLLNTNATTVNFAGAASTINVGTSSTTVDFGSLRIQGTTVYGEAGTQTITLDPYPAGGDSGGDVVVRGNFKVTGTTTTVNSTVMTVNDPIFTLGDSISEKTVTSSATTGSTTLTLDNTTGLNAGDIVAGNNIVVGTTIVSIDSSTEITINNATTGGIASGTDLIFTQGADDNLDRGIEFKYYNAGLKTGFFGYDESGISEDVVNYYFTYIPNATNTNNVFSGTVGSAYFKTVKLDDGITNGIPFFDTYKRITTTVAAGTNDATTSNQILTVNGSGVPVWTTTLDGGTY